MRFSSEERAASLSRLSDCSPTPPGYSKAGLARTLSFREQARSQCTFRSCDLVKGELLGMGFFGQVRKILRHCIHSNLLEVEVCFYEWVVYGFIIPFPFITSKVSIFTNLIKGKSYSTK